MPAYTATPLTAAQQAALAALLHRPTLYEIEIIAPDGRKALVAYAARRNKAGLRAAVSQRGAAVLAFLQAPTGATIQPRKGCPQHTHEIIGGGVVRFSNRTKRDVIMQGTPLTYIEREG